MWIKYIKYSNILIKKYIYSEGMNLLKIRSNNYKTKLLINNQCIRYSTNERKLNPLRVTRFTYA